MSVTYDEEAHAEEIKEGVKLLLRQLADLTDPHYVLGFVEGMAEQMTREIAENDA